MSTDRPIVRGVVMNWVAMAVGMVVSFFLSPFVVHHLGNIAYGIWTLVVSLASYMGLLDLGLQGAVTRYVSKHYVQGDHDEASRVVSAALWLRAGVGLLTVAIGAVIALFVTHLFRIPAGMHTAMQLAIVVTTLTLSSTLIFGVFSGVLAARHRFDFLSLTRITQTGVRATGVVWILRHGHGIVALALWELVAVLVGSSLLTYLTFRVYGELRIVLELPSRTLLHKFWSYSSWVFLINICQQVIYYSDNLVVGSLLSVTAVTFYAIGGNLIEYMRQTVGALTATFTPLASTLEAKRQQDKLQSLLIGGTRAALLVALPIEVALLFRGETFIALWMGPQYSQTSGQVLKILLLGHIFVLANATSGGIAYGMEKHRPVALWAVGEGVLNLTLSIILAQRIGLYGVAWGTAIPNLMVNILLWPRYICKVLQVPLGYYLWQSWGRSVVAVLAFGAACFWIDRSWPANGLPTFFLQTATILPIFIAGVFAVFWRECAEQFRKFGWWTRESQVGVAEH